MTTDEVGSDPDATCDTETGTCDTLRTAMNSASLCEAEDPMTIRLLADAIYAIADVDIAAGHLGPTADRITEDFGPNGLTHVVGSLTIEGEGATFLRADRSDQFRFLHVLEGADLTLVDLTLEGGGGEARDGFDGGAIYNQGKLTLDGVTLTGNNLPQPLTSGSGTRGGAVFNAEGGALTTRGGTVFRGNSAQGGGAIYNESASPDNVVSATFEDHLFGNDAVVSNAERATLVLLESTLRNNATQSAAVRNQGTLTVDGSTFSANSGSNSGGVYSLGGTVEVFRSTFSGAFDSSVGALGCGGSASTVEVVDTTVFGNAARDRGFAIVSADTCVVTLQNTVVAGNTPEDCGSLPARPMVQVGTNWSGDGSCGTALEGDPKLGPLADNGGPTLTHLPDADSALIDAGGTSCTDTDQRGTTRPGGGSCDIGAVEAR